VPLHRKKLRPDPDKVYGFERFQARFPAIFRNFAVQIAHIRQGMSSEQFWTSTPQNENVVMPGLVPGIHVLCGEGADGRDKARS